MSLLIVEYDRALLKSTTANRPVSNKVATPLWVAELDDRLGYGQALLRVGIHLVIKVFE